jgi:4-carboxymuconolactone decarboxylase
MRASRTLIGLTLTLAMMGIAAVYGLPPTPEPGASGASGQSSQASRGTLPSDIHAATGNRFPGVKREELNDAGKKAYDARGAVDGFGPGAIRLYSPPLAESMTAANDYLRRKSGLEPRLVELAILVAAREMDCEYIWTAHEPPALKAGLEQKVIDTVKHRQPLSTLGEKEAVIIQLGRDSITKHKVGSDTFARAVKQFGNQGVVNIVALMGDYAASSILLNAADQHVRPGAKSLLPVP